MLRKLVRTRSDLWGTLPVRLVLGIIFMAHGGQKLFGWFGGRGLEATAQGFAAMGLEPGMVMAVMAGAGEFFGGLLVLLGLLTRLGGLSLFIVMLVAIVQVHWGAFFAPQGMEYPLALAAMALGLIIMGGGAASVDAMIESAPGRRGHTARTTLGAH